MPDGLIYLSNSGTLTSPTASTMFMTGGLANTIVWTSSSSSSSATSIDNHVVTLTVVRAHSSSLTDTSAVGVQIITNSTNGLHILSDSGAVTVHTWDPGPRTRRQELEAKRWEWRRKAAASKAEDLLLSCLSERQAAALLRDGWFDVLAPSGSRYRIRRGFAGNVYRIGEDGDPEESYCIHPKLGVPAADSMLAQKLMLESEESRFLSTAVRRRLRPAPPRA